MPCPESTLPVAAPDHTQVAQQRVTGDQPREQTQIVLTDASAHTEGRTFSFFSDHQILTTEVGAKRGAMCGLGLYPSQLD